LPSRASRPAPLATINGTINGASEILAAITNTAILLIPYPQGKLCDPDTALILNLTNADTVAAAVDYDIVN